MKPHWKKQLSWWLEYVGTLLLIGFLSLLSADGASRFGGWFARQIGKRRKESDLASRNLKVVFPQKSGPEIAALVEQVWDNLGRTFAEYTCSAYLLKHRCELEGENILELAKKSDRPVIFFSAHIANWELGLGLFQQYGLPIHTVYRRPNNPLMERFSKHQRLESAASMIPKGSEGGRQMIKVIKAKQPLLLLMDQKQHNGINVPFLGRASKTSPSLAHLALKYDCLVIPCHTERLKGAYFRLHFDPPLDYQKTGNLDDDIYQLTKQVNEAIGSWIYSHPGQWFWLHNRWPN